MPGNARHTQRYELSKLTAALLPRWASNAFTATLCFALTALNISQIIVISQTMDSAMLLGFKKTCAIVLQPGTADYGGQRFVCLSADNDAISTNSPFGDSYVLSLGWAVTAAFVIPFSLRNLGETPGGVGGAGATGYSWPHSSPTASRPPPRPPVPRCQPRADDNIVVQVGGFVVFTLCMAIIIAQFLVLGPSSANATVIEPILSPVAEAAAYIPSFETVLANYFFVITIPSWLNE